MSAKWRTWIHSKPIDMIAQRMNEWKDLRNWLTKNASDMSDPRAEYKTNMLSLFLESNCERVGAHGINFASTNHPSHLNLCLVSDRVQYLSNLNTYNPRAYTSMVPIKDYSIVVDLLCHVVLCRVQGSRRRSGVWMPWPKSVRQPEAQIEVLQTGLLQLQIDWNICTVL